MCTLYNVYKEYLLCTHFLCIRSIANVQRIDYTQYRIHYKYIAEVLEKIMRRTEMIDRPS